MAQSKGNSQIGHHVRAREKESKEPEITGGRGYLPDK